MSHNITVGTGSFRLPTAGKYCDRDIIITAQGSAEPLAEYEQQNPLVGQYLEESQFFSPDDYTVTVPDFLSKFVYAEPGYVRSHPFGYTITAKQAGDLHLTDGGEVLVKSVAAGDHELINTTPGKVACWWLTEDGTIKQSGTVKPVGQVRMIKTTAANVRDIGGWSCDGGSVAYGKLYRGGYLSETDRAVLVNQLGVRHDLDIRNATERGGITESPLGADIHYTTVDSAPEYTLTPVADWRTILRTIFTAAKYGEPVYLHCKMGADRTGTVICIVEALLGVDQTDCDRDFELTSLATKPDARRRTDANWISLMGLINALPGDNFRDRVVNWCGTTLGFSTAEINEFRRAMINGNPEDVTITVETYTDLAYAAVAAEKTGEVDLGYVTTAKTGFAVTYNALSGGASGEAQYSGICGNVDFAFGFTTDARAYKGTIKSYALGANAGSGEHTIKVNYTGNGDCSVDGVNKDWNTGGSAPSNFTESLRAFSSGSHPIFTAGKAYMTTISRIEVTESGALVKTYLPKRRDSDGNVGFMDSDGVFWPSTGAVLDPERFETAAVMALNELNEL